MEDVDIDPFGEHELRPEEPIDKNIPLSSVAPRVRSIWQPTLKLGERETSFGGRESQGNRVVKNRAEDLCEILSQKWARTSEVFH